MRRVLLAAAVAAAVAAVAALAWRWWTAPPSASEAALRAALELAPADTDGTLALAQPSRAARWLSSRPQALVLVELAAPASRHSLPRVRGLLPALAREARGPLTVWWRGGDLAAGARVQPGAARALRQLAALRGFALRVGPEDHGAVTVRAGTAAALLAPPGGTQRPLGTRAPLSALARIGPRLWWARAGRSSLDAAWGEPPLLPETAGADTLATADLARLLAPVAAFAWLPHAPVWVTFGPGGWAAALPDSALPPAIIHLLFGSAGLSTAPAASIHHWRGPLGDLWVRPGPVIVIASRPELFGGAPADLITGESGDVHGADLARACEKVAAALQGLPGGEQIADGLRKAAPRISAVRQARWRLLPQGGRIRLEW
jgi:hypothetical protein